MSLKDTMSSFEGRLVVNLNTAEPLANPRQEAYRLGGVQDPREIPAPEALRRLLAHPRCREVEALVVGAWSEGGRQDGARLDALLKTLCDNARHLPRLLALFLGDIYRDESELSWIEQGDLTPVLRAFPRLEALGACGQAPSLDNARHDALKSLLLQCSGLAQTTCQELMEAHLPALERLELWLGTEQYDRSAEIADLAPLLSGKLFPHLKHLGLMNAEDANDVARALVSAPVLTRLTHLDLSLGTLTDEGAEALLRLPRLRHLKVLDLRESYVTLEMGARLAAALPGVEVRVATSKLDGWTPATEAEERAGDYNERYITHSE